MNDDVRQDRVPTAIAAFRALADRLGDGEALRRLAPLFGRYERGLFRVVVVGEVKKGKSSFINALLGEPGLVPISNMVATSTVFEIAYGPRRTYRVVFLPEDPERPDVRPPPIEVGAEQVAAYGTEDGNPDNAKRVDSILVELPHPLLEAGLTIFDTPGLGSLFRKHADVTWRYAPQADAFMFVLDSLEAVASRQEMDALARFVRFAPAFLFVQTKTDLVDEAVWQQWQARNRQVVGSTMGIAPIEVAYFPVSSTLKARADLRQSARDAERSGFPALEAGLRRLMAERKRTFAASVLDAVTAETAKLERRLQERLAIHAADTPEALDRIEPEVKAASARLETWREITFVKAVQDFQDAMRDLKRMALRRLEDELDPAADRRLIADLLGKLRESGADATSLEQQAGAIQSTFVDGCAQRVYDIHQDYARDLSALVRNTTRDLGRSIELAFPVSERDLTAGTVQTLNVRLSLLEGTQSVLQGGVKGGKIVAAIAGMVSLGPFGIGVMAIGVVMVGVMNAWRKTKGVKRDEALRRLEEILGEACRTIRRQAIRMFDEASVAAERKAVSALNAAVEAVRAELRDSRDQIADARTQDPAHRRERVLGLRARLGEAGDVLRLAGARTGEHVPETIVAA